MTTEDKIDDIMFSFDFVKVSNVMDFLNFVWAKNQSGKTDIYILMKTAKKYLKDCIKEIENGKDFWRISSGGFCVEAWLDDEKEIQASLKFVVEESDSSL